MCCRASVRSPSRSSGVDAPRTPPIGSPGVTTPRPRGTDARPGISDPRLRHRLSGCVDRPHLDLGRDARSPGLAIRQPFARLPHDARRPFADLHGGPERRRRDERLEESEHGARPRVLARRRPDRVRAQLPPRWPARSLRDERRRDGGLPSDRDRAGRARPGMVARRDASRVRCSRGGRRRLPAVRDERRRLRPVPGGEWASGIQRSLARLVSGRQPDRVREHEGGRVPADLRRQPRRDGAPPDHLQRADRREPLVVARRHPPRDRALLCGRELRDLRRERRRVGRDEPHGQRGRRVPPRVVTRRRAHRVRVGRAGIRQPRHLGDERRWNRPCPGHGRPGGRPFSRLGASAALHDRGDQRTRCADGDRARRRDLRPGR